MQLTLAAGTYYIALGDDGYDERAYYTTYLSISTASVKPAVTMPEPPQSQITTITLAELLNNPAITTIPYTTDLAYSKTGTFVEGVSDIVAGESDLFRDSGNAYYATAYKLTDMQAGDVVKIHSSHSDDAYLYIYKIEGDVITRIGSNDDWSYGSDLGYGG